MTWEPFSAEEFAGRVAAVRAEMRERDLAALLVTSPENVYYLVGLSHQGYFAFTLLVLPRDGTPLLVARSMERITIEHQAPGVRHVGFEDGEDPGLATVRALREEGLEQGRLGMEEDHMFFPPTVWREIREGLPGAEWVDASGLVDGFRFVKSPGEVACVRAAARVSDVAMRAAIETTGVGVNEQEVAAETYRAMILAGGEYPGFTPLIRSFEMLGEEHSTWRDRRLRPGDALFVELSGCVRRYHAPMSRLIFVGEPPEGAERARRVAVEAMEAVREALRPGALTGRVYEVWQSVVDRGLSGRGFRRHHCGYSVGIGFPPSWVGGSTVVGIRPGGTVRIEEGMVFHLFSWLIGSPAGDFVLSDTALVTSSGAEPLTSASRDLIVV